MTTTTHGVPAHLLYDVLFPGSRLPALSYNETVRLEYMLQRAHENGRLAGIREERERAINAERVALAHNSTDTQQAAAFTALPKSGSLRRQVYDFIKSRPQGATDDEIETGLNRSHQSVSARRRELVLGGFIHDQGERRKTRRGTAATVWRLREDADTCDPHPTPDTDPPNDPRYISCPHGILDGINCFDCGDPFAHVKRATG